MKETNARLSIYFEGEYSLDMVHELIEKALGGHLKLNRQYKYMILLLKKCKED